jgi:hypothetical protein
MTIGDIMDKFNLPDLCGALADFLDRVNNGQPLKIGGRRAANTNTPLRFDHLQVWTKVQLQNRSYHTRITFSHRKQSMASQRPRRCLIFLYARLV